MKLYVSILILVGSISNFNITFTAQEQEALHQAIINNSFNDVVQAVGSGANINLGVGNQPPLLLAILLKKREAIRALLNQGANPNINYLGKPIILFTLKPELYDVALMLFSKGVKILNYDKEKQEVINNILNSRLDEISLKILKNLGFDLKQNFDSADLTNNKWYRFLNNTNDEFSSIGPVLLDYGANPNQVFTLADGTSWTPLLLVANTYIKGNNYMYQSVLDLISALLKKGADPDKSGNPLNNKSEETPLSFAFKFDPNDTVSSMLIGNGVPLEKSIILYLQNGGSTSKQIWLSNQARKVGFMIWAVENNDVKLVKKLIDFKVDVNQGVIDIRNSDPRLSGKSYNALYLAILKGYGDIIDILINRGAVASGP